MCRLAAYLGPSILLRQFLQDPPHNLIKQSWAPREMSGAVLNADGFGLGWYTGENIPATYLNTQPAWSDVNITGLAASLDRPLWLGCVRSATEGQLTGLVNTQPFVAGNILYTHNGYVRDFNPAFKTRCHELLSPEILAGINGSTDSEFLFAIMRQQFHEKGIADIKPCLLESLARIEEFIGKGSALLNFIITDGRLLYAIRHAINADCPSLYFTTADAAFPEASLVASECLTGDDHWQMLPEHHLLVVNNTDKPELITL